MSDNGALPDPIAIDGPAASGKSTLGRAIAERLGYHFLDTGLIYRAFTLAAMEREVAAEPDAAGALVRRLEFDVQANAETHIRIDGTDVTERLREPVVEQNVSRYAAIPEVRERLLDLQREVAARGMAVLAGRDIGTVVLPGAPLKFYLDASEEARAERRSHQAAGWGEPQKADAAKADISRRDRMDAGRATAPLAAAPDAIVIDTTSMSLDEVITTALEAIECARA